MSNIDITFNELQKMMSTRTRNALLRNGIDTVERFEDLCRKRYNEKAPKLLYLGEKSWDECKQIYDKIK